MRQTDDTVPLIYDLSVAEDVRKVKNYAVRQTDDTVSLIHDLSLEERCAESEEY